MSGLTAQTFGRWLCVRLPRDITSCTKASKEVLPTWTNANSHIAHEFISGRGWQAGFQKA
jgi:hypothetical protein